jgi:hypothetical protein
MLKQSGAGNSVGVRMSIKGSEIAILLSSIILTKVTYNKTSQTYVMSSVVMLFRH